MWKLWKQFHLRGFLLPLFHCQPFLGCPNTNHLFNVGLSPYQCLWWIYVVKRFRFKFKCLCRKMWILSNISFHLRSDSTMPHFFFFFLIWKKTKMWICKCLNFKHQKITKISKLHFKQIQISAKSHKSQWACCLLIKYPSVTSYCIS